MSYLEESRRVAAEVFETTGKKCADDDPIIVAALFQAHSIREASREAAAQFADAAKRIQVAVEDARGAAADTAAVARQAVGEAAATARQAAADRKAVADAAAADRRALLAAMAVERKAFAETMEKHFKKAVREAAGRQSIQAGLARDWRAALGYVAFGMFIMAGIVSVACQGSFSWIDDARIGKIFSQIYPKLSPAAKAEVMKQAGDALRR